MVFSDTTNLLGIVQLCENYCNLGRTGISGSSNLLKEFTAYANKTNRDVWRMIFDVYGGWQYDDSNQTDLPEATCTLTSGTDVYAVPTVTLTIIGIEVKDDGGVWHALTPLTDEKIRETGSETEFLDTDSDPKYYKLIGDTIRLYPGPDYTQAASLKVFYDRGSHDFVSTDTTATPGFVSEFHDIVPVGASMAYWFSKPQGTDAYNKLAIEYQKLE